MAIVIYYRVYLVVTLNNSSKYYMNYYIWYYMVTANCINPETMLLLSQSRVGRTKSCVQYIIY